ncbi:hypothetical protein C1H46_039728 [Malus baccata]|uniref:EB domain-containing protein n=1 Tax=Malus baccata TaxID=106549 RepID=A0A540KKJ8_MALBA|nr:hypothetical protein C1H46_039728 [Malus baccata]
MGFVVPIFSIAICASVLLLGVSAEVEANIGTKADDSTAVEEAVANAKCPKSPPPADDSATAVEVIVDTKCWRHVDCEFAVQCPPGDIKFCVRGNCECVEGPKDPPPADEALKCVSLLLRASAEGEAEDKTVDSRLCLRDIDCEYVITCPPGGLKLCNTITRECICIGGQTGPPLSVEAPNSAVAVEGPVTLIADTEWKAKKLKRASESSVSSPN